MSQRIAPPEPTRPSRLKRPAWEYLSTSNLQISNEVIAAFDDLAADVDEETADMRLHRTILSLWNDGGRWDKIAKITRATNAVIWCVIYSALDLEFSIPRPVGTEEPPIEPERRTFLEPTLMDGFDAAAALSAKHDDFCQRNCNLLLLRIEGVSAGGVCRGVPGLTPSIVWDVVRKARSASRPKHEDEFHALIERQRAGRRGQRAEIIQLLKSGADPEKVRKEKRVHPTTIWRALQQAQPALRSA